MELPHNQIQRFFMPFSRPNEGLPVTPIVTREASINASPALTDLSERDKPWDIHRAESDQIAANFKGTEFNNYSERINLCSQLLDFRLVPDSEEGAYRLKLSSARLCHCRQCQVCAWRRSLMYKARAYKVLPSVIEAYPTARYLFLTLTVKNCAIEELRSTIKHLNESFARLSKLKNWPGVGYLKTVEVTRSKDSTAHPHLHVLVMTKASYFGANYLSKKEWCALWKQSIRTDYTPIMDVQAIKAKDSPVALLAEVIKYQTKPNDLIFADKKWFLEYTRQVHGTKAFALGGIFKEYFRELDKEETTEEMIGDDGQHDVDEGHLYFGWKRVEKKYRMVSND
jgi:plasmid rolling circle replication initiator protein Rep